MYQLQNQTSFFCKNAELYLPSKEESSNQIVYVLDGEKLAPQLMEALDSIPGCMKPAVVSIISENRLNDYTPWPAKALSERFSDFGGCGDNYVRYLEKEIIPAVTAVFTSNNTNSVENPEHILLGYSLGGLLAVYASFLTDIFSRIITVSGSFWYPEWDRFIQANRPFSSDTKYLMLYGNKEGLGKESMQKDAVVRSQMTYQYLCEYTSVFPLYTDDGGHHNFIKERLKIAAEWMTA